jgi:hypothetical protein
MYTNLGVQWASSVPAFLSLACVPLPFLFYRFGATIRAHSKYAAKAQRVTDAILNKQKEPEKSPRTSLQEGSGGSETDETGMEKVGKEYNSDQQEIGKENG